MDAFARRLHAFQLPLDDAERSIGQPIMTQDLPVLRNRGILSPLTLFKESVLAAAGDQGLQIHPSSMEGAGKGAGVGGAFMQRLQERFEFARVKLTLNGEVAEERFVVRVLHVLRRVAEAFLPIPARLE